ncbi:MAG: AZOBR_p60025 family cell surface glycopolymer formation protein [Bryobacteraceae bacterium]
MSGSSRRARNCAFWAAVAMALAFGSQALTVWANYGGNWTGLFCTGSRLPIPPALSSERIYVFQDSEGYDGQFYHYIAHDPFLQHGFARHIDAPRLRYRRILVPLLAWLFGGFGRWVHAAYIAVNLAFVFAGGYWLARCFEFRGMHPAWGLSILAIPGVVISLDRLVLDGALSALTAGFVWYRLAGPPPMLFAVVAAAPLVRETGLLLTGAAVLEALGRSRWRSAVQYAASALPALGWFAYVQAHTSAPGGGPRLLALPLMGIYQRLFLPSGYHWHAAASALAQALDWVATAGALLVTALALRGLALRRDALAFALALYGLLLLMLRLEFWLDAYSYGRMISPVLVLLLAADWNMDLRWPLAGAALMLPRIGLQLGWQLLGVLRRIAG